MIDATEEGEGGGGRRLTDEEIVVQSITFLLAGFEATSNILAYTSYLLALNPEIQEKLQTTIDEYFENNPVSGGATTYTTPVMLDMLSYHVPASDVYCHIMKHSLNPSSHLTPSLIMSLLPPLSYPRSLPYHVLTPSLIMSLLPLTSSLIAPSLLPSSSPHLLCHLVWQSQTLARTWRSDIPSPFTALSQRYLYMQQALGLHRLFWVLIGTALMVAVGQNCTIDFVPDPLHVWGSGFDRLSVIIPSLSPSSPPPPLRMPPCTMPYRSCTTWTWWFRSPSGCTRQHHGIVSSFSPSQFTHTSPSTHFTPLLPLHSINTYCSGAFKIDRELVDGITRSC